MNPSVLICFDYGEKRIGCAVGDTLTQTARSLPTLNNGDWMAIAKLIGEWRPTALVVGLPLNEDGTEQKASTLARRFADELEKKYALAIHLCDERFSSRAADDVLRDARASGEMTRRIKKGDRDAQAARIILEQWLAQG